VATTRVKRLTRDHIAALDELGVADELDETIATWRQGPAGALTRVQDAMNDLASRTDVHGARLYWSLRPVRDRLWAAACGLGAASVVVTE
jgi:hypothetical protein